MASTLNMLKATLFFIVAMLLGASGKELSVVGKWFFAAKQGYNALLGEGLRGLEAMGMDARYHEAKGGYKQLGKGLEAGQFFERFADLQVFADGLQGVRGERAKLQRGLSRKLRVNNAGAFGADRWEKKDKHWQRIQGKSLKGKGMSRGSKGLGCMVAQLVDVARDMLDIESLSMVS